MSNEAIRIRNIIGRLRNPGDVLELLRMGKVEVVRATMLGELDRFDRSVAIVEASRERLRDVRVRGQLPRYLPAA